MSTESTNTGPIQPGRIARRESRISRTNPISRPGHPRQTQHSVSLVRIFQAPGNWLRLGSFQAKIGFRRPENRLKPITQYNRFTLSPSHRKSAIAVALASLAVLLCFGWTKSEKPLALPVTIEPNRISADGYEATTVFIKSRSPERPSISFQGNSRGATIEAAQGTP